MLSDYINSCTEAKAKGDEASLRKIERNVARLGMDEMTLKVVAADEMERRKISKNAVFLLTEVEVMLSYDRSQITCILKGGNRNEKELEKVEKVEAEGRRTRSGDRTTQRKGPKQRVADGSGVRSRHTRITFRYHHIHSQLNQPEGGGVHTLLPVF